MPEGPEVKINVDFINSIVQSTKLVNIQILSGRYKKHGPFLGYRDLIEDKPTCTGVGCKGKFIYFNFDTGGSLWSTLGMSGVWQDKPTRHTRVSIENHRGQTIYYNDVRNFGTLKYTRSAEELNKKLNSLGPDVLNSEVSNDMLKYCLLRKPNKTVAENLMNQSIISGVGNYLKAEILYASQVSPHRICKDLNDRDIKLLSEACYWLTRRSYKLGGATLSTYRQPSGKKGLYSRRFAVYNQKCDPLGNEVIKETTLDKRTTHWVPKIQK